MSISESQIAECAERAIASRVFPGCVIGCVLRDGTRSVLPFGKFTYDVQASAIEEDTIYDVASITKSIPTSSLALMLIDEGKMKLSDKLIEYLPEFNNSDRERVLIKHLLTYTLDGYGLASTIDGGDGSSLDKRSYWDVLNVLLTHDFEKRPGTMFKYSNVPTALLGLVIERITGRSLDLLADEQIFQPLQMKQSTFYPERFIKAEIVPTEINWRGVVQGIVHDESAYLGKREGKIVGHAGLFSTAPDILNFLEMLLCKGEFRGRRYFNEETVAQMGTNQIPELSEHTGLGWELYQPRHMGKYASPRTFGKTGFTGTLAVCDVESGIAYVILSNRTFPERPADSTLINLFRAEIGNIILAAKEMEKMHKENPTKWGQR